ncbi:DNA-binding protein [Clostridium sp. 19966]|uniref:CvfB family protein n=1 Tax=Clostridium sp. 19966 TaxID=2768166 RepID=UPI0028DFC26B|nr:S1-like domain-containing RNA-binding protein [Clostridium sp. 19966]MDT8717238.1 DNA-binding protein [Clostridium sp. 19966]
MIKIGDYNNLKVVRETDFGYFLDAETGNTSDDVLIPKKSTYGVELYIDDSVEVFLYRDSKDRPVATLKKPLAKVGDLAYLKVVSNTKIGSFVDFGLERDILVPLKEKPYGLLEGNSYLFYIYLDKTGRIAATANIDKYLMESSQFNVGDHVKGTVYGFQSNGSAMIAVDNRYRGVILNTEYFSKLYHGDILDLSIIKIYEDKKLGLTPRKHAKDERTEMQEVILNYLEAHNGFMSFNDKSNPEDIYAAFSVSKNTFKNALGGLMKKHLITQDENGTKLNK